MIIKKIFLQSILFSFFPLSLKSEIFKIGYWNSSWNKKCGVAIYTQHLITALKKKNYSTIVYDNPIDEYQLLPDKVKKDGIKVLNIQYYPHLVCPLNQLIILIHKINALGIKTIVTFHLETEDSQKIVDAATHAIFHRPLSFVKQDSKKISFIPLGVPVFDCDLSKKQLREKYNFSQNKLILTTFGFLIPWKEYSSVLEILAPYLKLNPEYHLQLLTSIPNVSNDMIEDGKIEHSKIEEIVKKNKIENQVTHKIDFLSQSELSERLALSDLGFSWGSLTINDTSAAAKEFVSARLPLVLTKSPHYHDMNYGTIKVGCDKNFFVKTIIKTLKDRSKIISLKEEMDFFYKKTNNDFIISEHIEVFTQAVKGVYDF